MPFNRPLPRGETLASFKGGEDDEKASATLSGDPIENIRRIIGRIDKQSEWPDSGA